MRGLLLEALDQRRILIFPARLHLTAKGIKVDGQQTNLTAGTSVTAEVVTVRRKVIDDLWSPVAKAVGEAGRGR